MTEEDRFHGLERFDQVDATSEQAMFLAFLEKVETFPDVVQRRRLSFDMLGLSAGDRFADIGCGLGTVVRDAAAIVGKDGKAFGVDLSDAMVAEARRRSETLGIGATFEVADAAALPFADGGLDAYRAERVYQHLAEPGPCLAEAVRCLVPGGRIVLVDQDWDTLIFATDHGQIGREICAAFSDSLANGQIGRKYDGLLRDAGFASVTVTPDAFATADAPAYGFVVGLCTKAALAAGMSADAVAIWEADQQRRITGGRFFMSMTHFLARAQRP